MSGESVDYALKRVVEWLNHNSCTPSIRKPLMILENCQSCTVHAATKTEELSKKRKRAPEPTSTMSQNPSPKKRLLAVGSGEPPNQTEFAEQPSLGILWTRERRMLQPGQKCTLRRSYMTLGQRFGKYWMEKNGRGSDMIDAASLAKL